MEHLTLLVERYGLLLVWGNVFLAQAGVPLPVAPTLLVAGAFAARETLSWPVLLAGAVVASVLADYAWYLAGLRFGDRVLKGLYSTFSVSESRARQLESAFSRWGTASLIIAKFIPGLALVAPPIAGMVRMRRAVFLSATGVGAALWAGVPIAVGAYHRQAIHEVLATMGLQANWIGAAVAAFLIGYIGRMWWHRHAIRTNPGDDRNTRRGAICRIQGDTNCFTSDINGLRCATRMSSQATEQRGDGNHASRDMLGCSCSTV